MIGIILFSIAAYYAVSPGEQIDTRLIAGPESRAVFRLEGGRGDSQLAPLLVMALTEAQKAERQNQNLPGPLQWFAQANDAKQAEQIEQWMDIDATVTLEEGAQGPHPVAAINLPLYARMARWMFGLIGDAVPYAGHHYYRLDERGSAVVSFAENTLLWAADEQSLKTALDRLGSDQAAALPPFFQDALANLQGRWDLYGVSRGRHILTELLEDSELENVERWDLGMAAAGEESVEGRLTIHFIDAQAALRCEPLIEQHFRTHQDNLRQEGLTTTYQVRRLGSQVAVDFSLLSLRHYLAGILARAEDPEPRR